VENGVGNYVYLASNDAKPNDGVKKKLHTLCCYSQRLNILQHAKHTKYPDWLSWSCQCPSL